VPLLRRAGFQSAGRSDLARARRHAQDCARDPRSPENLAHHRGAFRIVVDSGVYRACRAFEPAVGPHAARNLCASRAAFRRSAPRARAGRTEPGICYRLWSEPETQSLAPFTTPENSRRRPDEISCSISRSGVSPIPPRSPGLIRPPAPAVAGKGAHAAHRAWGPSAKTATLPSAGSGSRVFPLHPRLAAMVVEAAGEDRALLAAEIAAGRFRARPWRRRFGSLAPGSSNSAATNRKRAEGSPPVSRVTGAGRGRRKNPETARRRGAGALLALAYPDRVAKKRGPGKRGEFLLANGARRAARCRKFARLGGAARRRGKFPARRAPGGYSSPRAFLNGISRRISGTALSKKTEAAFDPAANGRARAPRDAPLRRDHSRRPSAKKSSRMRKPPAARSPKASQRAGRQSLAPGRKQTEQWRAPLLSSCIGSKAIRGPISRMQR